MKELLLFICLCVAYLICECLILFASQCNCYKDNILEYREHAP